jgi:hypothetical protein
LLAAAPTTNTNSYTNTVVVVAVVTEPLKMWTVTCELWVLSE